MPVNMTLHGNCVFVMEVKDEVILEKGGPLIQHDRCPYEKKRDRHRHRGRMAM